MKYHSYEDSGLRFIWALAFLLLPRFFSKMHEKAQKGRSNVEHNTLHACGLLNACSQRVSSKREIFLELFDPFSSLCIISQIPTNLMVHSKVKDCLSLTLFVIVLSKLKFHRFRLSLLVICVRPNFGSCHNFENVLYSQAFWP